MATTSEDVWRLLAELTAAQKETDRQLKEVSQQQKETELLLKEVSQQQKENAQQQKETDKQLKELGKQIGGLGAKFGSFTEGLALPSMETILRQRFGMEVVSPSVRVSKDGQHLEIDFLLLSTFVGICFPLVSSPIAPKKSTLSKSSFKSFRESLSKFLSPTVPFNNSSILLVAVLFGDDWAVVTVVVDDMANKLENSNSKGIQGSKL